MKKINVHINILEELYKKDPESSALGKRIVSESIEMIHEMGFETFTFKKLGGKIGSNESSIYRYFESKHMLLLYLINWYWSWLEYRLVLSIQNITDSKQKLENALNVLIGDVLLDADFSYINEIALHHIIIDESSKAYHTKLVDQENQKGFYKSYKRIVQRVADLVVEYNAQFEFPHMLVSTVVEGANQQRFFSAHLPSLTDVRKGENNVLEFYKKMVFKILQ